MAFSDFLDDQKGKKHSPIHRKDESVVRIGHSK